MQDTERSWHNKKVLDIWDLQNNSNQPESMTKKPNPNEKRQQVQKRKMSSGLDNRSGHMFRDLQRQSQ